MILTEARALWYRDHFGVMVEVIRRTAEARRKENKSDETESGILLSVSSLPSRYGIGCFMRRIEFVDWLKEAGSPTGRFFLWASPATGIPAISRSPHLPGIHYISLEDPIEEGVLTKEECDGADFGEEAGSVDYERP